MNFYGVIHPSWGTTREEIERSLNRLLFGIEVEAQASAGTAPQEPNRTGGEQDSGAGLTKK
jgi:hypothetical protein